MGTFTFRAGCEFAVDRERFKLLRKIGDGTWQAEEARTRRIVEYTDTQLRALFAEGTLSFVSDIQGLLPRAHPGSRDFSDPCWDMAKIRRRYVRAVLELPSTRTVIEPVIEEVWAKLRKPARCPSPASVLRWKARYLRSSESLTALLDLNDRKGNSSERFDAAVIEIVERAIDDRYLVRERGTYQDVLDEAHHHINVENNLRVEGDKLPLPGIRLVQRLIADIPAFDRCAARYGREYAERKFRLMQGHVITEAALERAEIDHTPLDLMIIDEETGLPLGRPWLTVCMDAHTRCVLGLPIGFEPPSYLTVARCLKHAILPKSDLRTRYPDIQNDWEAHGQMRMLVVDNGLEFHSDALEVACGVIGIDVQNMPRKRPWFKGRIERHLGTVNRELSHKTPGTTFSNILDKDDYDAAARAVMTLSALRSHLYRWVCDVYHQRPHRTLKCPPAEMWRNSISPEDIPLPTHITDLDAVLGKPRTCKLTHKGLEVNGLYYGGTPELAQLLREHGPGTKLKVCVDGENLGSIAVFSEDGSKVIRVPALRQDYAAGLTEWQHRVIRRYAAERLSKHDSAGWLAAKHEISEKVAQEFGRRGVQSRTRMARFLGRGREAAPGTPVAPPAPMAPAEAPTEAPTVGSAPAPTDRSGGTASVMSDPLTAGEDVSSDRDAPVRDAASTPRSRIRPIVRRAPDGGAAEGDEG